MVRWDYGSVIMIRWDSLAGLWFGGIMIMIMIMIQWDYDLVRL